MKVSYTKNFIKKSKKLDQTVRLKLLQRITLFIDNPLHPSLRNHVLTGKYKDYRSIDITGDCRALYLVRGEEVIFDVVGSHSQIYG